MIPSFLAAGAVAGFVLAGNGASRVVAAQTQPAISPVRISPAAQEHLNAAADALNGIDPSTLTGDAAAGVAAVRRDFQQMRIALSNPASANIDWRAAYAAVERDLAGLIGPPTIAGAPASAPAPNPPRLDAVTSGSLALFRGSLELFNTSMTAETPTGGSTLAPSGAASSAAPVIPPPPAGTPSPASAQPRVTAPMGAPPQGEADASGAAALLDRIEAIVGSALANRPTPAPNDAVGTSGEKPGVDKKSTAGRVTVDRAALDEILAEVQQLKVMLRTRR
jgi:hypothetical protein